MVENIPGQVPASRGAAPAKQAASVPAGTAAGGAAFHALLEKLESNARELELQSRSIQNPKELTGAVDRAHASLQDVLTLGDQLLEAYREALARHPAPGGPASGPAAGGKP
jgi:hypothetical protein